MRLKPSIAKRLDDPDQESVRRNHDDRISELQSLPFAGARVVQNVSLADSVSTSVPHGLGRAPACVLISPPRGATSTGRIVESRASSRSEYVTLTATGHGATITVDLVVL